MLRFVLFGYPVRVHWMFWILCAFLGMGYLKQPGRDGLVFFLISTAVIFGSILWHELGHAWARKRCKLDYSEIELHGMGGLCGGPGYLTRKQSMFVAAMGPAASLALGFASMIFLLSPLISGSAMTASHASAFQVFVFWMLFANIGWAIMNLLPVLPLDGGRIFEGFMANRNPSIVPKVGMVVGGIVAVLGLITGNLWMGFLFGFLAYQNYKRITGVHGSW